MNRLYTKFNLNIRLFLLNLKLYQINNIIYTKLD